MTRASATILRASSREEIEKIEEVVYEAVHGGGGAADGAAAEAGDVIGYDAESFVEGLDLGLPHGVVEGEAVDEDDGEAFAGAFVEVVVGEAVDEGFHGVPRGVLQFLGPYCIIGPAI